MSLYDRFPIDCAHAGLTCSQALRVHAENSALFDTFLPGMTRDEMRDYLDSAPVGPRHDWRAGYTRELAALRAAAPGPADLEKPCRWIIAELGNKWPEVSLGAWAEIGLPLVLHSGVGTSDTYESLARVQGKRFLRFLAEHPEHADKIPSHPAVDWPEDRRLEPVARAVMIDELTGFQIGWAYNAARFVLGYNPMPNPALVTVDADTDMAAHLKQTAPHSVDLAGGDVMIIDDLGRRND